MDYVNVVSGTSLGFPAYIIRLSLNPTGAGASSAYVRGPDGTYWYSYEGTAQVDFQIDISVSPRPWGAGN